MLKRILVTLLCAVAFFCIASPQLLCASAIGEHMENLEKQKKQKQVELARLEELAKIIQDEIGTTKAQMAQNAMNTAPKIGYQKTNAQGLVTTTGGIVHGPSKHWVLDLDALRKEYEQADIYTPSEITAIIEYHKAYVQNKGFTAECSEYMAKMAESNAQLRTIKKYIERKKAEIKEIENALTGSSSSSSSGGSGGGNDGGGGGGY